MKFRNYNIVGYGERFYALHRLLGTTSLENMTEDELSKLKGVLVDKTIDSLKERILSGPVSLAMYLDILKLRVKNKLEIIKEQRVRKGL